MEKFRELGLDGEILKGIADLGFETPSPVQEKAIPVILGEENDLVVLAQTGTGKTAAFGLPLLQKIKQMTFLLIHRQRLKINSARIPSGCRSSNFNYRR